MADDFGMGYALGADSGGGGSGGGSLLGDILGDRLGRGVNNNDIQHNFYSFLKKKRKWKANVGST